MRAEQRGVGIVVQRDARIARRLAQELVAAGAHMRPRETEPDGAIVQRWWLGQARSMCRCGNGLLHMGPGLCNALPEARRPGLAEAEHRAIGTREPRPRGRASPVD